MARFLVVHGIADVRRTLVKQIAAAEPKAEVKESSWGHEGLQIDAAWQPDAVFIGLIFANDAPDVSTLRSLIEARPARPVVLCTVLPREDPNVVQALSLGAVAYVPQPMPPGALRETLAILEPMIGGRRRVR